MMNPRSSLSDHLSKFLFAHQSSNGDTVQDHPTAFPSILLIRDSSRQCRQPLKVCVLQAELLKRRRGTKLETVFHLFFKPELRTFRGAGSIGPERM